MVDGVMEGNAANIYIRVGEEEFILDNIKDVISFWILSGPVSVCFILVSFELEEFSGI